NQSFYFIQTQFLDQVLKPCLVPVVPFAVAVERPQYTFRIRDQLVFREEFMDHMPGHRLGAQTASQHYAESPLFLSVYRPDARNESQVLSERKSRIARAGRESELEFPSQFLANRVP